jgi:glyoxylase-like metal-dependent hydrolase (beta-lactamase superfamily II)
MEPTPDFTTQLSPVKISWFKAGYCTHPEAVTLPGASWKTVSFPALFALIQNTTVGNILFDTGYSSRFFTETVHFPNRLYALITPVFFQPAESAMTQLQHQGIAPEAIHSIVISHFHADHVGGIADFPQATYFCSQSAHAEIKAKKGFQALKSGLLPGLMPDDFEARSHYVETTEKIAAFPGLFEIGYDLLGDRSLIAVPLPGHAAGQLGLVIKDEGGQVYFLVADACWSSQAYRELIGPRAIAQIIFENPRIYRETLTKLHHLHRQRPDIRIIPTHCREIWQDNFSPDLTPATPNR